MYIVYIHTLYTHVYSGTWTPFGQKKMVMCPDFSGCNIGCLGEQNVSCVSRCPYFEMF